MADCYKNALKLAEEKKLESIGFPAISTGVYGYPMEEAAEVMLNTIIEIIPDLYFINKIRIVLFSEKAYQVHNDKFSVLSK